MAKKNHFFKIGESVKTSINNTPFIGVIKNITKGIASVDDGVHQHNVKIADLTPFTRCEYSPTDNQMKVVKGEYPFLKKGDVKVPYETSTFFVFKWEHSKQIGYGKAVGEKITPIDETTYNKWLTSIK